MNHLSLKTCLRPSAQSHGELWEEGAHEAGAVALITATSSQGRPRPCPRCAPPPPKGALGPAHSVPHQCGAPGPAHGVRRQCGACVWGGAPLSLARAGSLSALRLDCWSSWSDAG